MTVRCIYFSPTHSSRRLGRLFSQKLAEALGCQLRQHNWTSPAGRLSQVPCQPGDVLVVAFPVYAGRIPALLEEPLSRLAGRDTLAVPLAVYGNRHYDDALLEMGDLLRARGCTVVAGAAFVAEHSLTARVGTARPDAADFLRLEAFAVEAAKAITARAQGRSSGALVLPGKRPYKERRPGADIRPLTLASCTHCQICVRGCPMGIISADDPSHISAGCLHCHACVKACPEHAKYFDDAGLAKIVGWLEANYTERREPELFVEA